MVAVTRPIGFAVAALIHQGDRLVIVRAEHGFELPGADAAQGVPRTAATRLCGQLGVTPASLTLTPSQEQDGDRVWLFDIHAEQAAPLTAPPGTKDAFWLTRLDVQVLAQRTVDRAAGLTSAGLHAAYPGIRPGHLTLLAAHGWADIPDDTLAKLRRFTYAGTAA